MAKDSSLINVITKTKDMFFMLDELLAEIEKLVNDSSALNTITLARANLEVSCQAAVQCLCMIAQVKASAQESVQ